MLNPCIKPIFVLSLVLSLVVTQAQKNPYNEVSIASPTAASLGKYADIPVNYHTGIPEIAIPIYTVKEGPLQLPISLSYHAAGLKVMEPASWVGAGWALNAGGVITRTVRGAPDERGTSNIDGQTHGHLSDKGYNSYIMYSQPSYPNGVSFYDQLVGDGKRDGEPDLYFYNFGNYSGKFYFHDDGTPMIVPGEDIKIDYVYTGVGSIQKFILTTPDGTKYYFGKSDSSAYTDAIERTNPFNADAGLVGGTCVSSWYLNKVVSTDGVFTINLYYQPESYSYYTISMFPVEYNKTTAEYKLVKNFVTGVRLSQISFSNGKVDFLANTVRTDLSGTTQSFVDDMNAQSNRLDSIKISDKVSHCRKFLFSYDYFQDNTSSLPDSFSFYTITTDRTRLKLLSLQETSCDRVTSIPSYTFDYFTEPVTRRLSFGQDHWGFLNGVTTNRSLIPTYTVNDTTVYPGANRDASWPAMRAGTLRRITYPTGGYADFDFEPNYTWVNYTKKQWTNRFSMSAGYDGSSAVVTTYQNFSGSTYKMRFSNSTLGSQALLNIYNSANVNVAGWVLEAGQSTSASLNLAAGTYRLEMQKLSAVSGNGASASFDELITVPVQKNDTVGGLRIRTLTKNDGGNAQNMIISYRYENLGKSTGILYGRPAYVLLVRNDILQKTGMFTTDPNAAPYCSPHGCIYCESFGTPQGYFKSPCGIRPMETTRGNHIGYNEVKVSQSGAGYTIYRYYSTSGLDTIQSDVAKRNINISTCDPKAPNFPYAPLPFDWQRGELKYTGMFNETGQVLKETNYYYSFQDNPVTTPGYIVAITPAYIGTFYDLKTSRKIKDSVTDLVYSNGEILNAANVLNYGSSYHFQPTAKKTTTSTGDLREARFTYAMDFRISNCDTMSNCFNEYQSAWTSATIQYNTQYGSCNGSHYCQFWAYDLYRKNLTIARNNYISCRNNYLTGSTGFTQCMTNAKTSADAQLKPILGLRDIFNNAPIEVTNWRSGKLLEATFTRFDYAVSPTTAIYPSKAQTLKLARPSSSFTPAGTSAGNNSIVKDSRYLDESFVLYNNGNLTEALPRNGLRNAYVWDYFNNLPVAQAVNAAANLIAYTSFEADGNGGWTVASPLRDSTQALTGRKCYQLSNGAITKSGLQANATYFLRYWTKSGAKTVTCSCTQTAPSQIKSVNGWYLYHHAFTLNSSATAITLSGSGLIDELRLFPDQAQLTSYTYSPLLGITSMTDTKDLITYYEYDGLGRLKNVKDYQGNIVKNYQYNYVNSCGANCFVYRLQGFNGNPTPGYPAGVFNVNGQLLGNANSQSDYVTLWNTNAANQAIGVLAATGDPLRFNLTINAGKTAPGQIVGCRFYQFDLSYNRIDAIRNVNGAYVAFGDGAFMRLGTHVRDTMGIVLAPNTTMNFFPLSDPWDPHDVPYFIHTYSDTSLKTITIYHNDSWELQILDNLNNPATSLINVKNFRGNYPQNTTIIGGSCYQQPTANSVAGVLNWNTITSVIDFRPNLGDGANPWKNLTYTQDFMQNNPGLQRIFTTYGIYTPCYSDSAFKINRLKTNWNTYFIKLQTIAINDDHWNREDLSALPELSTFKLYAGTQKHSIDQVNNPVIPIPASVIDNVLIQISSGAGQFVNNGTIFIDPGGTNRTTASDAAVSQLKSKGWSVTIGGVAQ